MASILRTIRRSIERDEFKKKNGFSLSRHKKNSVKYDTIQAFKIKEKEKKQSKTAIFDKLKSILRGKARHGKY